MTPKTRTIAAPVTRAERRERALALRREGMAYPEIAKALGVALATAHGDVQGAMLEIKDRQLAHAECLRAAELERLGALDEAILADALRGQLTAIDRSLRISERRSKLLGLDSPTRIDLAARRDIAAEVGGELFDAFAAESARVLPQEHHAALMHALEKRWGDMTADQA